MYSHSQNTTYLAFELSEEFIARLRTLFPANKDDFLMESAENIRSVLKVRQYGRWYVFI